MYRDRDNYWLRGGDRRFSRRNMLRSGGAAGAGLAGLALVGCGGDDDDDDANGGNGEPTEATDENGGGGGSGGGGGTGQIEVPVPRDVDTLLEMFPYDWDEPEEVQTGGRLRVAVTWDTSTWDPTVTQSGGTNTVANVVYNRIMRFNMGPGYDPYTIEIEPDLAESYELSDDGMSLTFTLRDGINWQDRAPLNGRAFTSDDVKACYERYAETGVNAGLFSIVDTIDTPDERTVVINLSQPSPSFLNEISSRYVPIFPPELAESGEIETNAVGTGPFILEEARAGEGVIMSKNANYFEGEPYLDEIEWMVRPDGSTRLAMFRSDQLDYAYGFAGDLRELDDLLESNPETRVSMVRNIASTKFSLSGRHDVEDSPFRDERVRLAFSKAIDRNALIEIVNEGLGGPDGAIPWPWVRESPPAMEDMGENFVYDPDEARSLLEGAGYDEINLSVNFYNYAAYLRTHLETIMDQLRQVGIHLTMADMDYTTYNSQWIGASYDDLVYGWWTFGHEADSWVYQNMHSESPSNRHTMADDEIDELIEAQRTEMDEEVRREHLQGIWDRFNETMPAILLTQGAISFDTQKPQVRGLRFGGWIHTFYDWGPQLPWMWLDQS